MTANDIVKFIQDEIIQDAFKKIGDKIQQKFRKQIISQYNYLQSKHRDPIAILISQECMNEFISEYSEHTFLYSNLKVLLFDLQLPIGSFLGSPIFCVKKLSSSIMVVGDVTWEVTWENKNV